MRATLVVAALALVVGAVGQTKADTINFSSYAGQNVSSIDGVTFSLIGGPGPGGTPYVQSFFVGAGLTNSPDGLYPTSEILDFHFSTPVSNVSGTFDNEGTSSSGDGASYYQAFNSQGGLLETGSLPGDYPPYSAPSFVLSASGISDLQFNNNSGGTESWIFGVDSISFTPEAVATPEPASLTMLGTGLLAFGGFRLHRWRRKTSMT
jgi:PEP-CTERM motif